MRFRNREEAACLLAERLAPTLANIRSSSPCLRGAANGADHCRGSRRRP